jgi:hypothetical protein
MFRQGGVDKSPVKTGLGTAGKSRQDAVVDLGGGREISPAVIIQSAAQSIFQGLINVRAAADPVAIKIVASFTFKHLFILERILRK